MVSPNDLTGAVIGAAINVHQRLGPGLLESAYEVCLAYELRKLGFRVKQQEPVPIDYDDLHIDCGFKADLLVNDCVIVEIKAKDKFHPIDEAQLLSHLRLLRLQVGLLINFHVPVLKDGIKRMVNDFREA